MTGFAAPGRRALRATAGRPRGVRCCGTARGSWRRARRSAPRPRSSGRACTSRGARHLPRGHRRARPSARRRALLADGCRLPPGCRHVRAVRAHRLRRLPRVVDRLARHRRRLRTGRPPTRPGDRLLVVGAARVAEPLALPRRDLRLPRRTHAPSTATRARRGSGRCCCARPSMYYHTTPLGEAGCDGRQRLRRGHLQHAEPARSGTRASPRCSTSSTGSSRTRDWRYALVLTGVAATYVPWLLYPERTMFQFYTIAILPFMLLALTFALRDIAGASTRRPYRRTERPADRAGVPRRRGRALGVLVPDPHRRRRCRTTSGRLHSWMRGWI